MFLNGGPIFWDKLQITILFHFDGGSIIHCCCLLVKETILAYYFSLDLGFPLIDLFVHFNDNQCAWEDAKHPTTSIVLSKKWSNNFPVSVAGFNYFDPT